ncbi:MAG: SDR family oxidoreductase [Butyrivibrio sp.]|nr:SDR family oxidoreductase [Butyrivibrio sp.]
MLCGTNESKLRDCIIELENNESLKYMIFDMSDFENIEHNVEKAFHIFGNVDILVNSAGVHTNNVDFFRMTVEEYDRIMNVNIKGLYFVCMEFAKRMMKNTSKTKKHILLISSSRGSEPAWSPYGLSKWALNGLTQGLAQILLPHNIIVNGIAPGSTATTLIGVKPGDSIYTTENKEERLIMPDEVANIAKLLVSTAGDMVVGEIVHISGGRGIIDIR